MLMTCSHRLRIRVSLTELNETMKIMASVMKNIQDQQGKQKSTEEIQGAAMQSLDKMSKVVVEVMKVPVRSDTWKMVLPSLKSLNFIDKLNIEVVSNASTFRLWMKKLEHWLSTQANPVGMDIKVEKFFKQMHEAQEDVKT